MTHGCVIFTATISLLLLSNAVGADPERSWTASLPVLEREPRAEELVAYPVDQSRAGVNPPGFCWTPHDGAHSYRLEVSLRRNPSRIGLWADNLGSTAYPSPQTMAPGEYRWQVVYRNAEGKDYGVSRTRRFILPDGLPELPMPDVSRLNAKLHGIRPRLYLNGSRLERIREAVKPPRPITCPQAGR